MTQTQFQQIKEQITLQIVSLENEVALLQEKMQPIAPDCCLGDLTRFEMMHEQEIFQHSLLHVESRLRNLKHLFHTIDTDLDYGKCHECLDDISFQRLLLLPETKYCIHCAS
jgi:DnaK suppressor protein